MTWNEVRDPAGHRFEIGARTLSRAVRQVRIDIALTLTHSFNQTPLQPLAIECICIVRDPSPSIFEAHVSGLVAKLRGSFNEHPSTNMEAILPSTSCETSRSQRL